MAAKESYPIYKYGDMVKLRHSGFKRAKIVEVRGPLGPGGMQVYSVLVRRKPKPAYIVVTEDQIIPLPPKS
jgi:hypothetical protein